MDNRNIEKISESSGNCKTVHQRSHDREDIDNKKLIDMAAEQFAAILWEHILYEESKRKQFNADTGSKPP